MKKVSIEISHRTRFKLQVLCPFRTKIQAIIECGFTLKCIGGMIRTYSQTELDVSDINELFSFWRKLGFISIVFREQLNC